ncbi:MAG TPA: TetR/AcrR family transcriptional regulator [Anaerolineales bacterium]|nr:TetR/AcrR family transcriptional regulator [Anaerolineales bacterium]
MPKEKIRKGEATRLVIEDTAMELFIKNGYHATSMRQIAEYAGVALGGIYNHFASKEEIFQAIVVDKHPYKKILPLILEAQGTTVEDFLRNAAYISLNELEKEPDFINLMFIELVEFHGKHGKLMLLEVAPKLLPVFEKLVKSRGELRVKNPAVLARSFFGLVISYMITDIIIGDSAFRKMLPVNSMEAYIDIFLHGVLKEPA